MKRLERILLVFATAAGLLAIGAASAQYAFNSLQGYNNGSVPQLFAMNGDLGGSQDIEAYGAVPNITPVAVSNITGAVVTTGSTWSTQFDLTGALLHVALPGMGNTCATDGIGAPTLGAIVPTVAYAGVTGSADTTYRYEVTSVGPNGCETLPSSIVQTTVGDKNLGDGTWNQLPITNSGSPYYDRVYGCKGAACQPNYIGFATSTTYFDFGGFFNSAKNAIAATGTGPYSVSSGIAAPSSATRDTFFTTIAAGAFAAGTSITLAAAPIVSGAVATVMEVDNLTPIKNCQLANTNQGYCWVPVGQFTLPLGFVQTLSSRIWGIPPSSTNAAWMQGGSQLVYAGNNDGALFYFPQGTTRGGMKGIGLDVRHFYNGSVSTVSAAMAAINVDGNDTQQSGQGAYGNSFYTTIEDVQTSGAWESLQIGGAVCPSSGTSDRPSCDSSFVNYKNLTFSKAPAGGVGIVMESANGANASQFDHINMVQMIGVSECVQQYLAANIPDEFKFSGCVPTTVGSTDFDLHSGSVKIVNSEDEGTINYSIVWRGAPRNSGTVVSIDKNTFSGAEYIAPLQINSINGVFNSSNTLNLQTSSGLSGGIYSGCIINTTATVSSENDACWTGWQKGSSGSSAQLLKQFGMADTSQSSALVMLNLLDALQIVPDSTAIGSDLFLIGNAGNTAYNFMIGANQNNASCFEVTPSALTNQGAITANYTKPIFDACRTSTIPGNAILDNGAILTSRVNGASNVTPTATFTDGTHCGSSTGGAGSISGTTMDFLVTMGHNNGTAVSECQITFGTAAQCLTTLRGCQVTAASHSVGTPYQNIDADPVSNTGVNLFAQTDMKDNVEHVTCVCGS